ASSAPPQATETEAGSDGGNGSGGSGGGSGGGSEEKKKPAPTAATAVRQLAAADPGGRHICYRAFVTGKGWTAPECDGDTAGTVGQGRSLKALNIAVSGVNGTASAAFVHNPDSTNGQGHYPKPWSNAPDGLDNYFGSSKAGAPDMLGFTINVDNGGRGVCQSVHQKDRGWQNLACDKPGEGENYIFGGTLDNGIWLEAVKFTV
ncbi:hydrolase, partial [Streptomyces europaeiscabiei]|nr:hydrolase [Streptomyces europaeiscabiei]